MGLSSSPALFQELALKMIHYKPKLNETGEPIFSSPNHMELIWDPILQTTLFFDDLLVFTPLAKTYNETVKIHYSVVEKVMSLTKNVQPKVNNAMNVEKQIIFQMFVEIQVYFDKYIFFAVVVVWNNSCTNNLLQ